MLRTIVNTSCLVMALSFLLPAEVQANSWYLGHRVKGAWVRETSTAQMLVSIGSDGSFMTAASTGAFNTSDGALFLSPGVGTWTRSGPNSISLTQLQYIYSAETGDLRFTTRMTGEIVFDEPVPRWGRFTSGSAVFAVEGFPAGTEIVPGKGLPFGTFDNTFDRAP
jgi:hypothetical protein